MKASPETRPHLLAARMARWLDIARCPLVDLRVPAWKARKNYRALVRRYPQIASALGYTEAMSYASPLHALQQQEWSGLPLDSNLPARENKLPEPPESPHGRQQLRPLSGHREPPRAASSRSPASPRDDGRGSSESTTSSDELSNPTIRSASTLVIVPTLVRSASGELVTNLDASHFRLLDNGIEQKVFVEEVGNQPLAVVVLLQTGGAASSDLQNYGKLDTLFESALGNSTRTVALVTFDSRPKQIWNFPPRVDGLYYGLTHQEGDDHGAAIIDAVKCATGLLKLQSASFRRIILLLSQSLDDGSTAHAEDVVRSLAESGTTIYSLTFSTEKTPLKSHSTRHVRRSPISVSSDNPIFSNTPDRSIPLGIVKAMRVDTAAEVSALSGGEQLRFHDEQELEHNFSILARDIHNGYTLNFYPSSLQAGFHTIMVQIVGQHPRLPVAARASYWLDGTTQTSEDIGTARRR